MYYITKKFWQVGGGGGGGGGGGEWRLHLGRGGDLS